MINSQLTQVCNAAQGGTVSQYDYAYDTAGRRISCAKSGSAMGESRTDIYGYNARDELVSSARAGGSPSPATEHEYAYDPIGNRTSSSDLGTTRAYTANSLNQYTGISDGVDTFAPQFDDDGDQTLIQTKTGIWSVTYNGENRPVAWSSGSTNIVMTFDRMGRRVSYTETVGVTTNAHRTFTYDNYLQIADNIGNRYLWDPTEPIATRPLAFITSTFNAQPATHFYTHDGNKNVSELVDDSGVVTAHYEYAPFGGVELFSSGSLATTNPFRFSSEYVDDTLGLVYYNYRHYDPVTGRWMSRDPVEDYDNSYAIVNTLNVTDTLGLYRFIDRSCDCYKTDIDNAFSSVHKALSTIPKYETKRKQEGKPKTRLDELVDTIKGYYNDLGITPVHKKFSTSKDLDNLLKDFNSRATSGRMVPSLDCCPSTNEKMHPCNLNGNAAAVTKSDEIHLCCKGVNNPAPYGGLDCIVIHEMLHKIIHSTHEQEMTGENLQNERLVVRISTLFMGKQCPVPAYSETGQ